jgi:hypothetical protein
MEITQEIKNQIENLNVTGIANNALEFGLKAILPDFIEDDVIEIKNEFINEGFSEGLQKIVDKLEDVGKSVTGIFTGNFESIEQVKRVTQTDGLLDSASDLIDKILKNLLSKKVINKSTYNLIKTGKKEILSSLEDELESLYKEDTYSLDKLSEYCNQWKEQYNEKNYDEMEKTIKKIKQKLDSSKLVEDTINEARNIEKIQEYIKEKGSIENLSSEEKELLEKIK